MQLSYEENQIIEGVAVAAWLTLLGYFWFTYSLFMISVARW